MALETSGFQIPLLLSLNLSLSDEGCLRGTGRTIGLDLDPRGHLCISYWFEATL